MLTADLMTEVHRLPQDVARAAELRREIGLLSTVQSHLSGIPARQNVARIAERRSVLESLEVLIRLHSEEVAA